MSDIEHMETDGISERPAEESPAGQEPSTLDARPQQQTEEHSLRCGLLRDAFEKVVQYGLHEPSREEFSEHFPSLDAELVDALYEAFTQALAHARSYCKDEFQLVCSEHQMFDRLLTLDKLDEAVQQSTPLATAPLEGEQTTPSRPPAAGVAASQAASEAVVRNAEDVTRRHALRQEAAHLEAMLEKARRTEDRLSMMLRMRKETVEKMAASYQKVVNVVQQVYEITRTWPPAPQLQAPSD